MQTAIEKLGPAERVLQTILTHTDHLYHGRPGVVVPDARFAIGVRWEPVTHKVEGEQKVVYRLEKQGKRSTRIRIGTLRDDGKVINERGAVYGEFRRPGLYPETVAWLYRQIVSVWQVDNEFVARWASYAFEQDHRDLKVLLAAFMLVQSRKGDAVTQDGKIIFYDDDHRDVGEAMMLIRKDDKDLNPKLLMRVYNVLALPQIAAINRELGFGKSQRRRALGRWEAVVWKWLRFREDNSKLLVGLVKAGFRTTVMTLARCVGYKPSTPRFFEVLRWKQKQADDGRREIAIGQAVQAAETWEGLNEAAICQKITADKPDWKRVVGLLPKTVGVTRAILYAAMQAGSLSNKDLVILTPTIEELGLLNVPAARGRWEQAVRAADDMRAANIARNVKGKEAREKLQEGADLAVQKVVEKATRNLRVYFLVDISGSMEKSIERAKALLARFLQAFPLERTHVATFNSIGKIRTIPHASSAGVENAFRGVKADGSTSHRAGVRALRDLKPKDDEDTLFVFVGDEGEQGTFEDEVRSSGLRPMAFGLVRLPGQNMSCVTSTAARLNIPCFPIDEHTFDDPYAITRTVHALVAATPVGQTQAARTPRLTLVEQILNTELLKKPSWAA